MIEDLDEGIVFEEHSSVSVKVCAPEPEFNSHGAHLIYIMGKCSLCEMLHLKAGKNIL